MATERGCADVKHKRDIWHNKQKLMKLGPHRLVFIDETSTKTNMTRICGRSVKGTWLEADALYGHWKTQTFIAGLRHDGITAPRVLDGSMNRASFDVYVEKELAPTLKQGDIVILDKRSISPSTPSALNRAPHLRKARGLIPSSREARSELSPLNTRRTNRSRPRGVCLAFL